MTRRGTIRSLGVIASFVLSGAALLAPGAANAAKIASYLPAQPTVLHVLDSSGNCTGKEVYFVGVTFQWTDTNQEMARAAQEATTSFADASAQFVNEDDTFLRGLETRDVPGLLRWVGEVNKIDTLNSDVMIVVLDKAKRFASIDDQQDATYDHYPDEIAESSGVTCPTGSH